MEFLESCWCVLGSLAPWLLIGALVTGAMHAWLPRGLIQRILRGRGGVLSAVAIGVPLPLCSCGVIPAGVGLKEDGASDGATVGFMISTPQTGVDSIMVSAGFLGLPFALFKVGSALLTGVIGGWLADAVSTSPNTPVTDKEDDGERPGIGEGIAHAVNVLRTIWGWLLFGVLASAAISLWIPTESLTAVASWGPLGAGLAALALSLPLYVCATASVPIAAAFVAGGLPAGAALVFLMAGPATNVATMGAVHRALGGRILAVYLGTLMIGSLGLGLLFDFVLGETMVTAANIHGDHGCGPFGDLSAVLLLGSFVWFGWESLARWFQSRAFSQSDERARVIEVSGMTCGGCRGKLERVLGESDQVSAVTVNLEPGEARVHGVIAEAELRDLVREAGFEPGKFITE
jgi:uncharacterized protein